MRRNAWTAGLILVSVVIAGCSSDSSTSPPIPTVGVTTTEAATTSSPSATSADTVPEEEAAPVVLTNAEAIAAVAPYDSLRNEDGTTDPARVLAVFAAKHGPVPDVTPANETDGAGISDEDLADMVGDMIPSFTDEQQVAVRAWLSPGPPTKVITFQPAADGTGLAASPDIADDSIVTTVTTIDTGSTDASETSDPTTAGGPSRRDHSPATDIDELLANTARHYYNDYLRRAGATASLPMEVSFGPTPAGLLAYTDSDRDASGDLRNCRLVIGPAASTGGALLFSLAHETFHCFQRALRVENGMNGNSARVGPEWVREGTASFAGLEEVPGAAWPRVERIAYPTYVATPERPLIDRGYDAIGFFISLRESGFDVWSIINDLILHPTVDHVSGAIRVPDYEHYGAAFVGEASLGVPWILQAFPQSNIPAVTPAGGDGEGVDITVPAYATGSGALALSRDVLQIDTDVRVLLNVGGSDYGVTPNGSMSYCLTDQGCAPCPDGTAALVRLHGDSAIAAGSSLDTAGTIHLRMFDHDSWCAMHATPTTTAPTTPAPSGDCIVGVWRPTQLVVPQLPEGLSVTSVGDADSVFTADGGFEGSLDGVTVGGTLGGQDVSGTLTGSFTGTWTGDGDNGPITVSTTGSLTITVMVAGTPQTFDVGDLVGAPGLLGTGLNQIGCGATELAITSSEGTVVTYTRG